MNNITKLSAIASTLLLLSACGGSDNDAPEPAPAPEYTFEVTVQNHTENQPLSPITVMSHSDAYSAWTFAMPASVALETLAEAGDSSEMLKDTLLLNGVADSGPLMPSVSTTLTVKTNDENNYLTIISMLVNTNDAFTGLSKYDVSGLEVDESFSMNLPVYDSGTEANSEIAATLPGPVSNGEGFNAVRDDVDFVSRHPGVVSKDDGLMTSALDQSHRFESIVARVTIKRTE